jgi:hypothetical protein
MMSKKEEAVRDCLDHILWALDAEDAQEYLTEAADLAREYLEASKEKYDAPKVVREESIKLVEMRDGEYDAVMVRLKK